MAQVALSSVIQAPAKAVWETVADYENPQKYLDAVESCTVDVGEGAVRSVQLKGGGFGIEKMVHLDEENKTIAYFLSDSSLPISGYIAVMHVEKTGEKECRIEWSSVFCPNGVTEEEAIGFIESFYGAGFEGLKKRHES